MLRYVWIRIKRRPVLPLAILLFTAIIALVLCGLWNGITAAQTHFDQVYHQIEVRCTVTNLTGTRSDGLEIAPSLVYRFTGEYNPDPRYPENVADLVKNVQIKGSRRFQWNGEEYTLVGITSTQIAGTLRPENGGTVFYNEGMDEDFFGSDGMQCIIPVAMLEKLQKQQLSKDVLDIHMDADYREGTSFDGQLQIVGTYGNQDERSIYCPWEAYVGIIHGMGDVVIADALEATLRNNDHVPLLREKTAQWFVAPDASCSGKSYVGGIYLALDINDSRLVQARRSLENSLTVNQIAAVLVFALSAMAGAFVGFLMVHSRKKEIALMRTMGTPDHIIYLSFMIEQMIFAILGVIVGGSKFLWEPASWLCLFIGVYFIGLSTAVLIMLRKNLLATIKEDE